MSPNLRQIVADNRALFWSVSDTALDRITLEEVVETVLNYGDRKATKLLIEALGIKVVSRIFFKQTGSLRNNYFPMVNHYFDLYFKSHVPEYTQSPAN